MKTHESPSEQTTRNARDIRAKGTVPIAFSRGEKTLTETAADSVGRDLQNLSEHISSLIPTASRSSAEILEHLFESGGKRVRPTLFFLCSKLFNYRGDHLLPIAAVTEFVHTASLLHDDVIDDSTLRRNKPTANSLWGDESAVLVGDLIYARASELMAATGDMEIVNLFARAIRLMSEGELIQLENLFSFDIDRETYFRILEYKTAVLISASCKAAGLLAGAAETDLENIAEFGKYVGLAFQVIDDALDYEADSEKLGKPPLADLKEGKVTLPIILLSEFASDSEKIFLRNTIQDSDIADDDLHRICELVKKYETSTKAIAIAKEYTTRALTALRSFPEGKQRQEIEDLARMLLIRES